jgi:acyl carrier protein
MEEAIKIIEKRTGKKVTPETKLAEIAEDSLAKMELIAEIEQELKVRLREQDLLDMESVGDLLELLR